MTLTNKRGLIIGLAIILLSNAIALAGVAYNRSGAPTSQLTLSERELGLPYQYGFGKENSGIALRINWRIYDSKNTIRLPSSYLKAQWLDQKKLASLGFDASYPLDKPDSYQYYRRALSREVFLVLEYNGAAYQNALQQSQAKVAEARALQQKNPDKEEFKRRLKYATDQLQAEQTVNSRLFVIDAGLDAKALQQQYSEKGKYLIARGQIKMYYQGSYNKDPRLTGMITRLSVSRVNIPLE